VGEGAIGMGTQELTNYSHFEGVRRNEGRKNCADTKAGRKRIK